ncbi:MAG TPA: hypothetical protein VNW97_14395 [Candidatus Saccharimonadales bacterium]|jgi:hypothetical protein|nr:hypothetical protein [Candidatus Saccharimonadales bacterium]
MKKSLLMLPALLLLSGCLVPNKQYRKTPASIVPIKVLVSDLPKQKGCEDGPRYAPQMAFLEFDEFGEMWEPAQLKAATDLIEAAAPPPLVVTFFHGWKNNADPKRDQRRDGNAFGFSRALNDLACHYKNTPVIGVYVSWRGELVSKYWPLRRQFSYFNREEAAIRIPGARMTNALASIVKAAHEANGYAVLVGHSFGGLVMERALTQATISLLQEIPSGDCPEEKPSEKNDSPAKRRLIVPDLAVFVNSAAAATEAKQLLDVLKDYKSCNSRGIEPRPPDTALFISIASVSDSAVKLALPIGHFIPSMRYKSKGSFRSEDPLAHCSPPSPDPNCPKTPSQSSFYSSSAAHMSILQSHEVVSADSKLCKEAEEEHTEAAHGDRNESPGTWRYFSLPDTTECFEIKEKKEEKEKKGVWNDTPYWIMEVPSEIIPDHSTIFTERFIAMLKRLVPTQKTMNDGPPKKILSHPVPK